ncbi:MAG TPA: helix-turn-helix domain-containing protein [Fimbriimonadaceae bacterium]|nr:helix-turn-helix domain-containing protein [Fimbriimonadaceae bacterium]
MSRTEAEYVAAISRVLAYVQKHLDEELTPHRLANVACFSQHHFHRIFRAVVGESVMDHVRRLRLERAAYRLKTSQESVGRIALDAGYGAQEAFTRMFQACFGLAPRAYRRSHGAHALPASCGVHYSPRGFSPLQVAVDADLLDTDRLCPAHRLYADAFEERWEEMLSIVTGFASLVYPISLADRLAAGCAGFHSIALEKKMTETMSDIDKEIDALQEEVEAAKQRLIEAQKRRPREQVKDYVLQDVEGRDVYLSELFGEKDDLILVHNMGTGCAYCTMWADGFTGLAPHLQDRAAFVVCTPDKPEVQKRFAAKRNWNFKMVSAHDSPFIKDMGFWHEEGASPGPWPGVSTFHRDPDGRIYRIARSFFGPGDDFCAVWPFLDMLQEGANGWEPKYSYGEK